MTILSQPRDGHSAAAFVISSELTEIVIFGGSDQHYHMLSDTTILRLSKFYKNKKINSILLFICIIREIFCYFDSFIHLIM